MAKLTVPGRKVPTLSGKVLPPVKRRPPLSHLQPAPDPINQKGYPGDPEGDCAHEIGELEKGFRERMRQEQDRFSNATGGGYYFVAVFETEEQCSAFLKGVGLDKGGDLFVDGRALADRVSVDIPAGAASFNTSAKIDPKLSRLVAAKLKSPKG